MSRIQIAIRIPEPLNSRVRRAAKRDGVSINAYVVKSLEQTLLPTPRRS